MKLIVEVPNTYLPEREYIIKVLIDCYLGIPYVIKKSNTKQVLISLSPDYNKKTVVIEEVFFKATEKNWLKSASMPKQPIKWWEINESLINLPCGEKRVPVLFGADPYTFKYFQVYEDGIFLGLDVFGSAFFMLTRYEEMVRSDRDEHDRFPASASLAHQEGFLERPIIDEYVEILWACMKYLWPRLERKENKFQVCLSHDVDTPYYLAFMPFHKAVKTCSGDILKRKNPRLAADKMSRWIKVKRGELESDPYNAFNYIMKTSEENNIKSTFYFMSSSDSSYDSKYMLEHPYMKSLLNQINTREHKIGLHPSYNTYLEPEKINAEFMALLDVCNSLGIDQDTWGGRQHYLRWQAPDTWQSYADAGLDYDATLSYADHAGFRCGTCREFPVFNLLTRQTLNLIEKPLIAMECSLLDERYMGLDYEGAWNTLKCFIDYCKLYKGTFSLLWHNSQLVHAKDIDFYNEIIKYSSFCLKR